MFSKFQGISVVATTVGNTILVLIASDIGHALSRPDQHRHLIVSPEMARRSSQKKFTEACDEMICV
jgi:hypothetical protein